MNVDELLEEMESESPIPSGVDLETFCETEEPDGAYDDEDFWESIDLLALSRRTLLAIVKHASQGLTVGRKKPIERHCDDVGQFLANFIELGEKSGTGNKS